MPYQISYAHIEFSENSENGENTGPTFDNVDENIENSVIIPARICPLPNTHPFFHSKGGEEGRGVRYLNRCI